jgi:5-methylcytosine-specific restriction enzyme A
VLSAEVECSRMASSRARVLAGRPRHHENLPPTSAPGPIGCHRSIGGCLSQFRRGELYTRRDVFRSVGISENVRGGNWFTGYNEHNGCVYVFANVGTPGRTGHDYANAWKGECLRWFGKNGTRLNQPQIQKLIDPSTPVHLFWREANDQPFRYAGEAKMTEVKNTSPVEVIWSFP